MTGALIVAAGLCLLGVPAAFGVAPTMGARESARLIAATLVAGFAAVELGLVLLALPALLRTAHVGDFAELCARVLTPLTPGRDVVGWVAGLLAVIVAVRAVSVGWRAHRGALAAAAEPWLGAHEDHGDYELVVLPTDRVVAFGVPTRRPQVVISEGLIACLDEEQLDIVIGHEAAHHRSQHWRYVMLASAIEGALRPLPVVARSSQALRTALEAWADEDATDDSPHQRAHLRSALAAVACHRLRDVRRPYRPASVAERARRLDRVMRRRNLVPWLLARGPIAFLVVALLTLALSWAAGVHHAVATIGYCPD